MISSSPISPIVASTSDGRSIPHCSCGKSPIVGMGNSWKLSSRKLPIRSENFKGEMDLPHFLDGLWITIVGGFMAFLAGLFGMIIYKIWTGFFRVAWGFLSHRGTPQSSISRWDFPL